MAITFTDIENRLKQYMEGCIGDIELLLCLQEISPEQVRTLLDVDKLPTPAYIKIKLSDLDEENLGHLK